MEQVEIEGKPALFLQGNRHRSGAEKPDHGFINGEARIRVNHFVAWLEQRQQGKKYDRFAARHNGDVLRPHRNAAGP